MVRRGLRRWSVTPDVLRAALHDPDLRRLQVAWTAINAGRWAFLIANLVYAYDVGGATAAGFLGLATFLAPTILAPLSGLPTNRWRPARVLVAVTALRMLAVALAVCLVALDGPFPALLVLVTLEAGAGAFNRPLHMTMLPLLARTPRELVAANAASGAAEGIGTFLGPAVGGVLLGLTGLTGAVLGVLAVYAVAVAAIARVDAAAPSAPTSTVRPIRAQLASGVRAFVRLPAVRWLIFAIAAQTAVRGALTVLSVVAAIELLGMGEPGAGLLNAAIGAGGVFGAVGSIALAGRSRLAPWFAVSLAFWGAPIALIGLFASAPLALAAMVVVGTSNAVLDVAAFTLLQRTTPNETRAPVLGLVDSVASGTQAVGGLIAPLLIAGMGIAGALVATGLLLPIVAVVTWAGLRHIDDAAVLDPVRLERIRADPLFEPLSMAIVEQLAGGLERMAFEAGASLIREGDVGDRYYLLERGRVEVTQGGRRLREHGPGEGVGEIALLRDVPRTASVTALSAVEALTLSRADFLEAVTGHPASRSAADALVRDRLPAAPGAGR